MKPFLLIDRDFDHVRATSAIGNLTMYVSYTKRMVDFLMLLTNSDWWTWKAGSRLNFWRWPEVWRIEARDGARGLHHSPRPPPRLRWPKLTAGEKWMQDIDAAKLEKLIRRGYLETGRVRYIRQSHSSSWYTVRYCNLEYTYSTRSTVQYSSDI
jgi:hypothetical protein